MNKLMRNLLAVLTLLGGRVLSMMPGREADTGEDTVMAEGMDSTEAMALMGIMDTAEDMDSTSTMDTAEDMDSTSTMDAMDGVSVSGPHLS
jgi:hypothetical protein